LELHIGIEVRQRHHAANRGILADVACRIIGVRDPATLGSPHRLSAAAAASSLVEFIGHQ
jgi:hypothetical protein